MSDDDPVLRDAIHEVAIEAGLDEVWAMLTSDAGLSAWYAPHARIDAQPGGVVELSWGDGFRMHATVDAVEPLRRLRYVYRAAAADGGTAEVGAEEWLLTHRDGVTHVRLVHSLPDPDDDWDEWYADYRRGWRIFLRSLRFALESAARPTRVASSATVDAPDGRAAAWRRILGGLGLEPEPVTGHAVRLRSPDGAVVDAAVVHTDVPNSLLLAVGTTVTLVVDLEEDPEGRLVTYLQAATHLPEDGAARSRRSGWLGRLTAAATPA